jgi:hypothetical protein
MAVTGDASGIIRRQRVATAARSPKTEHGRQTENPQCQSQGRLPSDASRTTSTYRRKILPAAMMTTARTAIVTRAHETACQRRSTISHQQDQGVIQRRRSDDAGPPSWPGSPGDERSERTTAHVPTPKQTSGDAA